MMIQRINTVSFGDSPVNSIKSELQRAQDKKDELLTGALGGTGAVAVANGNKAIKAIAGVSKKTSGIVSKVPGNTKTFQAFFLNIFKSAETVKGLGWIAKAAKNPAVRGFGKVFGGFAAVGLCATDFANMVNTGARIHDGGKFPTLDSFVK